MGNVNMCKAIQEMIQDGRDEGKSPTFGNAYSKRRYQSAKSCRTYEYDSGGISGEK